MDTEEMYRRGLADAERDEINSFYYEHYYPYRRGYDEMRRRLRRPGVIGYGRRVSPALLALALLALAGGAWWYLGRPAPAAAPPPTAAPAAVAPTSTPPPTRTPIFPTATPEPTATPTPAGLRIGGEATVATDGLRVRREPSLAARVVARFRKDQVVTVVDGPREADGYIWWQIEGPGGSGWSAERSAEGDVWLAPAPAR